MTLIRLIVEWMVLGIFLCILLITGIPYLIAVIILPEQSEFPEKLIPRFILNPWLDWMYDNFILLQFR